MNGITILIWITIAIIGIIAIILVKLHYKGNELENDEGSILPNMDALDGMLSSTKSRINSNNTQQPKSLSPNYNNSKSLTPRNDAYIVPEVEIEPTPTYEYENANQVLINYGNEVEKFQEPIKQNQMDIMTQNNKEKTELKDLFTIDELIKESKRKDSEREKEAQKISNEAEDLTEIKESIENPVDEALIEEIVEEELKEGTITDLINEVEEETSEQTSLDIETQPTASQKDIEEAINTASKESEKEEEIESISESENITDVLLNSDDEDIIPNEEIKEPSLKTPHKVESTDSVSQESEQMDLDYRKDLEKVTNKIKGSKIFQEVKEKLTPETEEFAGVEDNESFIRNVTEYDEYEPIINETHVDFDASYEDLHELSYDQRLRQENTRKVFNMAKNSKGPELAEPKVSSIKDKPERDNIKIDINNNEVVLKKGDEIIFTHLGETYSSQVYAINGDDISVRYRRKDITIKPSDVKKVY